MSANQTWTDAQGEEHCVPFTVEEKSGFVLVDGKPVMGNHGLPIIYRPFSVLTCQTCKQCSLKEPTVLHRRYERAIGRTLYWLGSDVPKSFEQWRAEMNRPCDKCAAKLAVADGEAA